MIWFKHNNEGKILALCPTQNKGYEFLWEFVFKICICLHLYFIDLSSFLILFFKSGSFLRKTNTIWHHLCVESQPWPRWTYLWNRQTHRHRDQTCGCQGGKSGWMDWEFGISRLNIGWINNKALLYSTGSYVQYPVINHNEKEYEKECVCV